MRQLILEFKNVYFINFFYCIVLVRCLVLNRISLKVYMISFLCLYLFRWQLLTVVPFIKLCCEFICTIVSNKLLTQIATSIFLEYAGVLQFVCCCVYSYDSMKSVCDRYNRALDSLLQLVCAFSSTASQTNFELHSYVKIIDIDVKCVVIFIAYSYSMLFISVTVWMNSATPDLLLKHQISVGRAYLDCYLDI